MLKGELVFTTGEGGIFPSGYLVGKLVFTDDEDMFVDPGIDWHKVDVVQVLNLLDMSSPGQVNGKTK